MRSVRTQQFRKLLEGLPEQVQRQADIAYGQFKRDPWYQGLQFKEVAPSIFSVRIGLHHRALGTKTDNIIIWYWIGTHAEYDKLI